jgi:hypothetical protein
MSPLVEKLSNGLHEVEFETRINDLSEVEDRIRNGFVYVKFVNTKGGTELGIKVDPKDINFDAVDFKAGAGTLHVEGTCTLDYEKVKCIADIDLATRSGRGYLKVIN